MSSGKLDHVGIAVRDLDAIVEWYRQMFGAEVVHRERIESDGVDEALIKVADSYIQLTTPTREDSTMAKFLEKRGEGIHHVGYTVPSVAAALEHLRAEGGELVDQAPRIGSGGTTIAFVHPKSMQGVLVELVEEGTGHRG